jgi:lipopolysaccharide biosynthesis glycosyltransferase
MLPDQDIITALYGTKIKLADTMRFNLSDRILGFYNADIKNKRRNINWVRQNTAIIHYCGKNKPWKNNYSGKLGVFYHELLQEVRIKNAG